MSGTTRNGAMRPQPDSRTVTVFDGASGKASPNHNFQNLSDSESDAEQNPDVTLLYSYTIIDSDDENDSEEIDRLQASTEPLASEQKLTQELLQRTTDPQPPWVNVEFCTVNGQMIQTFDLVEIATENRGGPHKGDFLLVSAILLNLVNDDLILRGLRLRRNSKFIGQLPHKRNDVCMIVHVNEKDERNWYDQAQEEVSQAQIGKKRSLSIVQRDWPYRSAVMEGRKSDYDNGPLICRFIKIWIHTSQESLHNSRHSGKEARHAELFRIGSHELIMLEKWFAKSEYPGPLSAEVLVENQPLLRYSFADICHGAGGVSRAASILELDILWACDNDRRVGAIYKANFPHVKLFPQGAETLHSLPEHEAPARVDILHFSLPCKYWSPAHTRNGTRDDANMATIFMVKEILDKFKPRIVMFEQTYGLLTMEQKHHGFFQRFVQQIVEAGYNLTWKIVDFSEYGIPQARKRLVIYASNHSMGIPLPKFPKPNGTRFVNDVIKNIPLSTYHQPHLAKKRNFVPYDGDTTLVRTITCSGGNGTKYGYHPSGMRDFTPAEVAALQGIPPLHVFMFGDSFVRSAIGDMVPSEAWVPFLAEAIKILHEFDVKASTNTNRTTGLAGMSVENSINID